MTFNSGYSYREGLGPGSAGHSTLSYLAQYHNHSTESEWKERIHAGEILVNDKVAHGAEQLREGQSLVWNRPAWEEAYTPQSFQILYQDNFLLLVNKPSGLPTIPGGGFLQNTLLHLVRAEFPTANPLHRLGRATSGIVLFALNNAVARKLSQSWSKIEKQYRALGCSVAIRDEYDIRTPIGPVPHPRLGNVYAACNGGKAARSYAIVVQRRHDTTIFDVNLHSGRPHQIRIHLASIGHPLVGDPLYASGGLPKEDHPGLPGDSGYWLHAKRLVLEHPHSGSRLEVESPIPEILCVD